MTDISSTLLPHYNILAGTGKPMILSRKILAMSMQGTENLVPGCMLQASDLAPAALQAWSGSTDNPILGVLLQSVTTEAVNGISVLYSPAAAVKNTQCHVHDGGARTQLTPGQWDHAQRCNITPVGTEYTPTTYLFGVVLDEDGDPVEGAVVGRYNETLQQITETGEDGSYAMVCPSGVWNILVALDLGPYYQELIPAITLVDGTNHELNVELLFMVGGIGGTIDDGTDPVKNASVIVYDADPDDPEYGPVLTDAAGLYVLSGIRIGDWNVRVTRPGYDTDTQAAIAVAVDTTTAHDVSLTANMGALSGTVIDENSDPVVGATVIILDEFGDEVGTDDTDGAGEYTIPAILAQDYTVTASDGEVVFQDYSFEPVTVTEGAPTAHNFAMHPIVGSVAGIIADDTDPPVPLDGASAVLYLTDPATPEYGPELSAVDGSYEFEDVRIGIAWKLKVTLATYDDVIEENIAVTANTETTVNIEMTLTP